MSKNITIQQKGVAKAMSNVRKITTALISSGAATGWIPDDETHRIDKAITANGEYLVDLESYYAYNNVTVDVPGGAGASQPGGKGSSIKGVIDGVTYIISVGDDGYLKYEFNSVTSSIIDHESNAIVDMDGNGIIAVEPIPDE